MGLNRSRISQSSKQIWENINQVVSELVASLRTREESTSGLTRITSLLIRPLSGESLSKVLPTLPALSSRRSVSRPSSLTPVLESVSESNSKKTTRESPPSSPVMVVCPSATRTTRFLLRVSVVPVTPSVTCPACVSSSPRLLVAVSSHSGPTRRRRCQSDSTLLHNEYNQASRADRRPQPAQLTCLYNRHEKVENESENLIKFVSACSFM